MVRITGMMLLMLAILSVSAYAECTPEGQMKGAEGCCEGLTETPYSSAQGDTCTVVAEGVFYCRKCGDGTCDASMGENYCNCPDECTKEAIEAAPTEINQMPPKTEEQIAAEAAAAEAAAAEETVAETAEDTPARSKLWVQFLLVLVISGAIGAAGYFFFKRKEKKGEEATEEPAKEEAKPEEKKEPEKPSSMQETQPAQPPENQKNL